MKPVAIQHPLATGRAEVDAGQPSTRTYEWRQVVGLGLIVIGVLAVGIGWFGVSGEAEPWKQMPFLASGGIGGAAAIAIGITCLISFEHASDRRVLLDVLTRLEAIEADLDDLRNTDTGEAPPESTPASAGRRTARRSTGRA